MRVGISQTPECGCGHCGLRLRFAVALRSHPQPQSGCNNFDVFFFKFLKLFSQEISIMYGTSGNLKLSSASEEWSDYDLPNLCLPSIFFRNSWRGEIRTIYHVFDIFSSALRADNFHHKVCNVLCGVEEVCFLQQFLWIIYQLKNKLSENVSPNILPS